MSFRYVDCINTVPITGEDGSRETDEAVASAVDAVKESLGLKKLESIPVVHCSHAFGLAVESLKGWKVVFSGDTRPCDAVVEAAKGATLLVHEVRSSSSIAVTTIIITCVCDGRGAYITVPYRLCIMAFQTFLGVE